MIMIEYATCFISVNLINFLMTVHRSGPTTNTTLHIHTILFYVCMYNTNTTHHYVIQYKNQDSTSTPMLMLMLLIPFSFPLIVSMPMLPNQNQNRHETRVHVHESPLFTSTSTRLK
jgi:hypothetical protein